MPEPTFLVDVIVILLAAVVAATLSQRLGLGAVVGYLLAGAVIGPSGLGFVSHIETTRALAELGVVFLLFTVGLELPFARLRVMGRRIFVLGAVQVALTAGAIAAVAGAFGQSPAAAFVIGTALALSSTAIVLRLLVDRHELTSRHGRSVFAILLVQDLAVGPLLVCVLALGRAEASVGAALGLAVLKGAVAIVLILGLGRLVLQPALRAVARARDVDVFAAFTLLLVLAAAWLTQLGGLSMGFGALLAGMFLAETPYRHQVAAEIQPFRGLLLGLFFMSVSMSVDLAAAAGQATSLAGLAVALLAGKALVLFGLARAFGQSAAIAAQVALLLAQAGEFAFVLLSAAIAVGVVGAATGQLLLALAGLTMIATPLLARAGLGVAHHIDRRQAVDAEVAAGEAELLAGHVIIAGFGRVGRTVAARLTEAGEGYIAVDLDPRTVAEARQRGLSVYFGDATRPEILTTLNLGAARALVVALDDPGAAQRLVTLVHYIFPELAIYARARDETHAEELDRLGVEVVIPELAATGARLADAVVRPRAP